METSPFDVGKVWFQHYIVDYTVEFLTLSNQTLHYIHKCIIIHCLPVLPLDFSNSSYISDLSSNMSSSWSDIPMSLPWWTSPQWSRDLSRSINSSGLRGLISLLKFLIPVLNFPENLRYELHQEKIYFFAIAKTKTQICCTADEHLSFHYRESTIPLLPKSEFSRP